MSAHAFDPDPIDESVGAALRGLRTSRKVSMSALACHLGVSYQQIQKYERGRNRMVASTLFRIADFFDIDVGELFAPLSAAEGERTSRIVVIAAPAGAAQDYAGDDELTAVMMNYARIGDRNVRYGIEQLIERLADAGDLEPDVPNGPGRERDAP